MVAELDGELVGVAATRENRLQRMFVDPCHHRKGVGTALFCRAERVVAKGGHSTLRLTTTGSALAFYAAMGVHQIDTHLAESGVFAGTTMYVLEKTLNPQ